jgi:hypothetical protein
LARRARLATGMGNYGDGELRGWGTAG